jgi:hypothetical protein
MPCSCLLAIFYFYENYTDLILCSSFFASSFLTRKKIAAVTLTKAKTYQTTEEATKEEENQASIFFQNGKHDNLHKKYVLLK